VLLLLQCSLGALHAQSSLRPPVIDLSFGVGQGYGGPPTYTDRFLLTGSGMVTKPVHDFRPGALLVAANATVNLLMRTSDCVGSSIGTCSGYPSDVSLSVLGGWSMRSDQWSAVRVLAGPAFVTATDGRRGLGATSRLDVARRVTSRISFVVWAQGHVNPKLRNEYLTVGSAGIGVRALRVVRPPRPRPSLPPGIPDADDPEAAGRH